MTEQFQVDYLDRYEGVQAKIHIISQFGGSSAERTTYLGKVVMSGENALKGQEQILPTDQFTTMGTVLNGTAFQVFLCSGSVEDIRIGECKRPEY